MTVRVGGLRRGVAQPGRAPGSGPGGRRFKSSLPDHSFQSLTISGSPSTVAVADCVTVGFPNRHCCLAACLRMPARVVLCMPTLPTAQIRFEL
jgi:hypothetical protein